MTTATQQSGGSGRPLLALRSRPGRLALWSMRLPRPLYHRGWGGLLGHTFLLIVHQSRKTGRRREAVAMAPTPPCANSCADGRSWPSARRSSPKPTR